MENKKGQPFFICFCFLRRLQRVFRRGCVSNLYREFLQPCQGHSGARETHGSISHWRRSRHARVTRREAKPTSTTTSVFVVLVRVLRSFVSRRPDKDAEKSPVRYYTVLYNISDTAKIAHSESKTSGGDVGLSFRLCSKQPHPSGGG